MARIFGFDIGTTSIGSAVIDHDPARNTGSIVHMGVRIFPEARDPKGTPLNQQRRQKRMARRQLRRRRARRRILGDLLREAGLLPAFSMKKDSEWHALVSRTAHREHAEPNDLKSVRDPYVLRRRGLHEALQPHQLGRVLYHLAQNRHFKGRELEEGDEAPAEKAPKTDPSKGNDGTNKDEELKTKAQSAATAQILKDRDITLGAWLSERQPLARKRGEHATRANVESEFEKLWTAQKNHHLVLRNERFKAAVKEAIFFQRPVFWRKNTLGDCRWMPGEELCPRGSWLSAQKRMLEKLNNLAVEGGNARRLDAEERAAILAKLQTQGSMTWNSVQVALKPLYKARGWEGLEKSIRFNLQATGDKTLLGNPVEQKLATIFGNKWEDHPYKQQIRDAIHQRLWQADYGEIGDQRIVILSAKEREQRREDAAHRLIAEFGVTREQADKLKALKLPTGWEPFSIRALEAFLPRLEEGERFGDLTNKPEWEEWRNITFPFRAHRPTGEFLNKLPSPREKEESARLAQLRNPTVVRTQNELRKVVNNLIAAYGKPDFIRVELAREVGKSKREREEMQAGIRKNEKRRKDAAKDLEANGIKKPSPRDIEKWLLWKESGERCPYTGDQIGFDALFRENRYEVEHIWPRSRCFDSTFRNKTLCRRDVNIEKGNRTPWEAFGTDEERWRAIYLRVEKMQASKGSPGMARGKVRRFLSKDGPDDSKDFSERQLRDTSYAAKQILAQLKRLWPDVGVEAPVNVQAVSGSVTAQLRKLWQLNNILSDDGKKTRADHRHHAVDALAVACTHTGLTNRLSRYWQERDNPAASKPDFPAPWPTIRKDAEKAVDRIIVSHRVWKKVSGPLHDEMPLGYTGQDITKNRTALGIFVKRVAVEKLTLETLKIESVEQISRNAKFVVRDKQVREALLAHLTAAGKPDKAYPPYPRVSPNGPEIRKVRALTVQQKNLMVPVSLADDPEDGGRRPNGFADPANNHHIAIYRLPDGKVDFGVVSLYEASRRLARREPVVRRNHEDGAEFVMSLAAGDAIEFPDGDNTGIWIVCGAWASGQIVIERAIDAVHATTTRPKPSALLKEGVRKVSIDPIGRIRKAND